LTITKKHSFCECFFVCVLLFVPFPPLRRVADEATFFSVFPESHSVLGFGKTHVPLVTEYDRPISPSSLKNQI
jgi:hypothetical protein